MKLNYYSVIKKNSEYPAKTLVSFFDKKAAESHRDLLNKYGDTWRIIDTEISINENNNN